MRWNSRILRLGFALTVVSLLALPALAASPVADVLLGGGQVEWVPASEFAGLKLTVSGPEGVSELSFGPGENPRFDLAALAGDIDGIYTWELTARPLLDQATTRALAEARVKGEDGNRTRPASLPPRESLIQTGSFRVEGGAIVQPATEEDAGPAQRVTAEANRVTAADQVIPDDLIVQRSLCVGFDCVNNEDFGFDTIRLKENNLRLHFLDTSVGSFPSNDWRLVANDSASGGRNVFYLEDSNTGREVVSVEAAAPTNALWVDSTGNVGFGTSTPVLQLHIKDGNTPGVRLEQDTSSGFAAQTWDIAGNEANFFVRSASTGSQLPFRVRPGAPSSSIDIASDGDVGIGTASPSAALHVLRNDAAKVLVEDSSTTVALRTLAELKNLGQTRFLIHNTNASLPAAGGYFFAHFDNGTFVIRPNGGGQGFFMDSNGNITTEANLTVNGTFSNPSSRTLKENFHAVNAQEVLEKIRELPITTWTYKNDPDKLPHIGPVVEDFRDAFGLGTNGKYIFPADVQGVTLAALQGLSEKVAELESTSLSDRCGETQLLELQSRLATLEQQIEMLASAAR